MPSNYKRKLVACLLLLMALIRYCFKSVFFLLWLSLVALVVASIVHNLGVFHFSDLDSYLSKIELGDGLTALGILFASYGIMSAWRRQKREELMISSVEEIDLFFREVTRTTNRMRAKLGVLDDFRGNVLSESNRSNGAYSAGYIMQILPQIEEDRIAINEMAIRVYDLDAREALIVWSIPMAKKRFDRAVSALEVLSEISYVKLPLGCSSAEELIARLQGIDGEYANFIDRSQALSEDIAGSIGGIRGAIFGRYFPPTLSGARSVFEINDD